MIGKNHMDATGNQAFIFSRIKSMQERLASKSDLYKPSNIWDEIKDSISVELVTSDINSFKSQQVNKSLGLEFVGDSDDYKFACLSSAVNSNRQKNAIRRMHKFYNDRKDDRNITYVCMMLDYAFYLADELQTKVPAFNEPELGSPLWVLYRDRRVTIDTVKSIIEYITFGRLLPDTACIAEVGGGYGRLASLMLSTTQCTYFMFDIPPILALAEWYMGSLFPDSICPFSPANDFHELERRMRGKRVIMLTPDQIELFPDRFFDSAINIDSFSEMKPASVMNYMSHLSRTLRPGGLFYLRNAREEALSRRGAATWACPGHETYAPVPVDDFDFEINRLWPVYPAYFELLMRKRR